MLKRWYVWLSIVSILIPSVAITQVNQTQLKGITVRIDVEGSYKEAGGSGVIVRHIIGSHIINEKNIKQIADYDLAEITIQSSAKYISANIGDSQQLQPTEDLYVSGYPLPSFSIPKRLSTPTPRLGQFIDRLPPDSLPKGKKGATPVKKSVIKLATAPASWWCGPHAVGWGVYPIKGYMVRWNHWFFGANTTVSPLIDDIQEELRREDFFEARQTSFRGAIRRSAKIRKSQNVRGWEQKKKKKKE